jgi:hypothetical protein
MKKAHVQMLASTLLKNIAKHSANPDALDHERFERSKRTRPAKLPGNPVPKPALDEYGVKAKGKKKPPAGSGGGGAPPPKKPTKGKLKKGLEKHSKDSLIFTPPMSRAIRLEWK